MLITAGVLVLLTVGVLAVWARIPTPVHHGPYGWMSAQWLAEQRATHS